jgi:antitoxin (DNA-binding transcriptional repressor) of toxin-antitoxin stability system
MGEGAADTVEEAERSYAMKIEVDVGELPARIRELHERASAGDVVVITVEGKPMAWLNPIHTPNGPRQLGFAKGFFTYVAPDFDDPMPDDFRLGAKS